MFCSPPVLQSSNVFSARPKPITKGEVNAPTTKCSKKAKRSKKKQKNRLQHHDVPSFGIMLVVRKKYKTTPGKTIWYVRYVINMATTTLVDMSSDFRRHVYHIRRHVYHVRRHVVHNGRNVVHSDANLGLPVL